MSYAGNFNEYSPERFSIMPPFQPPIHTRQSSAAWQSAVVSTVGGALALIGFFLPWLMLTTISLNGWFLVQHAADPSFGLSITSIAETYLTFASAIATLIIGVIALAGRRSPALTYIQALGSLIGVSDLVLNLLNVNGSQFDLSVIGYGFWLSFVGFVLGVVGALWPRDKERSSRMS